MPSVGEHSWSTAWDLGRNEVDKVGSPFQAVGCGAVAMRFRFGEYHHEGRAGRQAAVIALCLFVRFCPLLEKGKDGPGPSAAGEASSPSAPSTLCRWGDPVLLRFMGQKVFVSSEHCSALALPPQGGGRNLGLDERQNRFRKGGSATRDSFKRCCTDAGLLPTLPSCKTWWGGGRVGVGGPSSSEPRKSALERLYLRLQMLQNRILLPSGGRRRKRFYWELSVFLFLVSELVGTLSVSPVGEVAQVSLERVWPRPDSQLPARDIPASRGHQASGERCPRPPLLTTAMPHLLAWGLWTFCACVFGAGEGRCESDVGPAPGE